MFKEHGREHSLHFSSGLNSLFESHDLYIQIRAFLDIPYKRKE